MANEITIVSTTESKEQVEAALQPRARADAASPAKPADPTPAKVPPVEVDGATAAAADKTPPEPPAAPSSTDDAVEDDADDAVDAASEAGRSLAQRKSRLQARIDKLIFEKHTTSAERDKAVTEATELRRELATLKGGKPEGDKPAAEAEPAFERKKFEKAKPKQGDFDDYDKYEEARDDWTSERARFEMQQDLDERAYNDAKARREQDLVSRAEKAQADYTARFKAAEVAHPDLPQLMKDGAEMPLSAAMVDHMRTSDDGVELLYYFLTHPDDADRVGKLPHARALVEMGKISAKLDAPAKATDATAGSSSTTTPPAKKTPVSKAPEPMTRVGGAQTTSSKPADELSFQDYKAQRNADIAARRSQSR